MIVKISDLKGSHLDTHLFEGTVVSYGRITKEQAEQICSDPEIVSPIYHFARPEKEEETVEESKFAGYTWSLIKIDVDNGLSKYIISSHDVYIENNQGDTIEVIRLQ